MKHKTEFSKKIFNIVIVIYIIVITFSMILMWKTQTTDALSYLIPSISGLTATSIGFYYWKAKFENQIKLTQEYKMSLEEVQEISNQIEREV